MDTRQTAIYRMAEAARRMLEQVGARPDDPQAAVVMRGRGLRFAIAARELRAALADFDALGVLDKYERTADEKRAFDAESATVRAELEQTKP